MDPAVEEDQPQPEAMAKPEKKTKKKSRKSKVDTQVQQIPQQEPEVQQENFQNFEEPLRAELVNSVEDENPQQEEPLGNEQDHDMEQLERQHTSTAELVFKNVKSSQYAHSIARVLETLSNLKGNLNVYVYVSDDQKSEAPVLFF